METVGSLEAKADFSGRLDRVAPGEEIASIKWFIRQVICYFAWVSFARRCPMPARIRLRALTPEERHDLEALAHFRISPARLVERAGIVLAAAEGRRVGTLADELNVSRPTVSAWVRRFNDGGLAALEDLPRSGRPHTYAEHERAEVIAAALTDPKAPGLPLGCWTLDRLQAYLNDQKAIPIRRSRIDELLRAEGLQWRHQETWFGERVDPAFAEKRGLIETLYTDPPEGGAVICLDEMGPQAARSFPGQLLRLPAAWCRCGIGFTRNLPGVGP
jgi:transposase